MSGSTKYRIVPSILTGIALACAISRPVIAQPRSGESGSIVVFPKVVADATRDTVIEIANVSNSLVRVRCFYLNAAPRPSGDGAPLWSLSDFEVFLTKQQPTYWVVSRGRVSSDPLAPQIPPVARPFTGELLCVQLEPSGFPVGGNGLIGHATIKNTETEDVAEYTGIGFQGTENAGATGFELRLDHVRGTETGQYDACPQSWLLDHASDGAVDPQIGPGSAIRTSLTIMPCSQDFGSLAPETVEVQFDTTNEFEQLFSASTTITCWADTTLGAISEVFTAVTLGSSYARTKIRPIVPSAGMLVVAQEFHETGGLASVTASAAVNAYTEGARTDGDVLRLPE